MSLVCGTVCVCVSLGFFVNWLGIQDLSGDERLEAVVGERDSLDGELKRAKAESDALRAKMSEAKERAEASQIEAEQSREELLKLKQEKDAMRSSLLELEIANHEHQVADSILGSVNGPKNGPKTHGVPISRFSDNQVFFRLGWLGWW